MYTSCVTRRYFDYVVVGLHNNKDPWNPAPNQRAYGIIMTYTHGEYQEVRDNDIMLVELNQTVDFMDHIQPVCLPGESQPNDYDLECYATGWGAMLRMSLLISAK